MRPFSFAFVVSLSILAAAPALAAGVTPAQATAAQREQAQTRFLHGKDKLAKGQRDEALADFNASLDVVESPNTRLYVGRCLRDMGRLVAAYAEYGRTETEAKEDPAHYDKAGQAAHEERVALESRLAFLTLDVAHADATTTLKIAGEEVKKTAWSEPVPVMPGSSEIVVETPGHAEVRRTITVAAAEKKPVSIDAADTSTPPPPAETHVAALPPPAPPASNVLHDAAFVAGGVALVGVGMFAFFGLKSNSDYSDLDAACHGKPCPPGHDAAIGEGRAHQTTANVGLVVFGVGAAAAVTLWLVGNGKSRPTSASAKLSAGPSFVGLRGAF